MSDEYLIKLKACGQSDERIAKRLGCSIDEVQKRWRELLALNESMIANGYGELQSQWLMLSQHYEMVGRSMIGVAAGLSNVYEPAELKNLLHEFTGKYAIENFPHDALVDWLIKHCILLKPYIAIDPEKELQDSRAAKQN